MQGEKHKSFKAKNQILITVKRSPIPFILKNYFDMAKKHRVKRNTILSGIRLTCWIWLDYYGSSLV